MKKNQKKSKEKNQKIRLVIVKILCIIVPILLVTAMVFQTIKNNFIFSVAEKEIYNKYVTVFYTSGFVLGAIFIFLLTFHANEMTLFSPKKTEPKKIKANNVSNYLKCLETELKEHDFKSGTYKSDKFNFRYYIKSEKEFEIVNIIIKEKYLRKELLNEYQDNYFKTFKNLLIEKNKIKANKQVLYTIFLQVEENNNLFEEFITNNLIQSLRSFVCSIGIRVDNNTFYLVSQKDGYGLGTYNYMKKNITKQINEYIKNNNI